MPLVLNRKGEMIYIDNRREIQISRLPQTTSYTSVSNKRDI